MKKMVFATAMVGLMAVDPAFAGSVSESDLKAAFVGKTYDYTINIQAGPRIIEINGAGYTNPDGTARAKNNRGETGNAKWSIQGDKLCFEWDNSWTSGCNTLETAGDGQFKTYTKNGHLMYYKNFRDGNPEGL